MRDARDPRRLNAHSVRAVIDLAIDESPAQLGRETALVRYPLMDGSGNQRWLLVAAIRAVAGLVQTRVPTLVACSAGLSRSPSLAAAGIALATGVSPTDALRFVIRAGPADLSPGLWADVLATLAMLRALPSGTGLVPRSDPANDPE